MVSDAEEPVKRQGLHALTVPIAPMVEAFTTELAPAGFPETGLPPENLQARVRGVILMGLSNADGHLVLTTGNKSELACGYSTLPKSPESGTSNLRLSNGHRNNRDGRIRQHLIQVFLGNIPSPMD